jgi:malonyl-CoA decarboxylase
VSSNGRPGFLKQSLQTLQRRWQLIAGSEYGAEAASFRPSLPPEDWPLLREQMANCLEARGGEVLARSRAAALGRAYLALDETGRANFLRLMAREFDVEPGAVEEALTELRGAGDPEVRRWARRKLISAAESPRRRILTRFNALPQGVKFLVDLRADLLPLADRDPLLASLDDDLRSLLASWFDVDFLELRRISWHTASGALLEKFMAYEAVHPVESWEDLKNRLDYDRRYFAFFHPRMPEEPLIFVEVALVEGMAGNVQDLLDPSAPVTDPSTADTAIFYSISNAQRGLAGVSFGGFLIKRVVDELRREFPRLKVFSTLSPLPGFLRWVRETLREDGGTILPRERKKIERLVEGEDAREWLGAVLENEERIREESLEPFLEPILLRLAARYLLQERRDRGGALDPVAHFHLSNGARVERLNWMGDASPRGMAQSAGMMVNYLYDTRRIEDNHEAYRGRGRVTASSGVRGLLKE